MAGKKGQQATMVPVAESEMDWGALTLASKQVLLDFFTVDSGDALAMGRARIAASVLSSYTRHEATESARATTAVMIAKTVATNTEEFAAYLRVSAPQLAAGLPALAPAQLNGNGDAAHG